MQKVKFWFEVLLFAVLVFASSATAGTHSYYLPYFVAGDNWWTGVGLRNSDNSQDANISVIVYVGVE